MSQQRNSTQLFHNVTLHVSQKSFIIWYQQQPYIAILQVQDTGQGHHEKPNKTTLYVVGVHSHMERTGYGEQLMYTTACNTAQAKADKFLRCYLWLCQVPNGCSLPPKHIWIWYVNVLVNSMHLNLVGRTTHKGSKICGQTPFSSIATTASDTVSPPCTRSKTAVKSRMIRSMTGEQSGNLNTSKHFNKVPEHKVTDIDSTLANARTQASKFQHCLRGIVTMATSVEQEGNDRSVGAQASKQNGAVVLWNPRAGSKLLFAEGITWVRKQTLRSILPALRRALSGCDVIRCSSAFVSAMCSFQRSPSFRRKDNFCRPHSTKSFSWFCCRRRLSWFPGWYNLFISWGENYDAYCIRKW